MFKTNVQILTYPMQKVYQLFNILSAS